MAKYRIFQNIWNKELGSLALEYIEENELGLDALRVVRDAGTRALACGVAGHNRAECEYDEYIWVPYNDSLRIFIEEIEE